MSDIPFVLSLDSPIHYGHDLFPNRIYRQHHSRHHDPLDMHTLGLIARLGAHGHHLIPKRNGSMSTLPNSNKNGHLFEVTLDVGLFQPEELSVKVVDGCVVIEGKHEEREDNYGHISRHFVRRYDLPQGYDPDAIVSKLSVDGVLTVWLPQPSQGEKAAERIIQIQHTGPSDLFIQSTNTTEKQKEK